MSNKETQVVVAGSASAVDVDLGFIPDSVEVFNATDRTAIEFSRFDTVNTFGVAVGFDGAKTKAATAGAGIAITNSDSAFRGFTLGATATANGASDVLVITAKLLDYVLAPE